MIKRFILLFVLLSAFASVARAVEMQGTVKGFYINDNGLVLVNLVNSNGTVPQCKGGIWPFGFSMTQDVAKEWVSMLLMAKATGQAIKVGYTPNETTQCKVSYFYFNE